MFLFLSLLFLKIDEDVRCPGRTFASFPFERQISNFMWEFIGIIYVHIKLCFKIMYAYPKNKTTVKI